MASALKATTQALPPQLEEGWAGWLARSLLPSQPPCMSHIQLKGEDTRSVPKKRKVSKHHAGVIASRGSGCLEGIMHV